MRRSSHQAKQVIWMTLIAIDGHRRARDAAVGDVPDEPAKTTATIASGTKRQAW